MNFFKKNLIFLLSAGLIISNFSSSFSMKRQGPSIEEPDAKRCKIDDQSSSRKRSAPELPFERKAKRCRTNNQNNQLSSRLSELNGYRDRFINAIKNNNQEELAFFEQDVDIEFKNQTFYLPLKNILFLDTYTVLILDAKIDAKIKNSSKITLSLNSSDSKDPAYYDELTKLWEILTGPFLFIFKTPEQINNNIDRTLDFHGMNLDFILEYSDALIASGNYNNFNINYIENFLRNNNNNIDPNQLSPQLQFILKAINNTVENEINYSEIYARLKEAFVYQIPILSIHRLNIDNNLLDIILPLIKLNRSLQSLDLSNNKLTTLPENIGDLINLNNLNISYNQLTNLPNGIGNLINLKDLNIFHNRLISLPDNIGNLINLKILDVSKNQLTALPNNLGNLINLKKLIAYNNQLTFLPNSIGNLNNLQELYVSSNQLNTLPDNVCNLSNLRDLYIPANQLTALPNDIGNLGNLKKLSVSFNQLTTLPNSIGNLSNLLGLGISSNQLNTLPENICNLSNLWELDVSSNQLNTLPNNIGNLINLKWFIAFNNQLSTLPYSFGKLIQLQALELWDNAPLDENLQINYANNSQIRNWLQEHFPEQ